MDNILKQIADQPALLQALKEALLKKFDYSYNKPKGVSFVELGIWITAVDEGRAAVFDVFKEIEALRIPKVEEQENPAV